MRIGINIPNELLSRVKAIRPEVNVSQICREALQERVDRTELTSSRVVEDGMKDLAERFAFSDKAPLIEPDWVGMALEDARDWVRSRTIEEWEEFCYQRIHLEKQGRGQEYWHAELRDLREGAKTYGDRRDENTEWFWEQYERDLNSDVGQRTRDAYGQTWLAYVNEVRRMVDERRRANQERIEAERRATREALCTPELPEVLLG